MFSKIEIKITTAKNTKKLKRILHSEKIFFLMIDPIVACQMN